MTRPPDESPHAKPAWKPLDARQRRVLGVLIEKAKTTPAAYPMTVNAIVTGSNQKNNREPLTSFDDIDVEKALDQLRTLGVVSEIDWLGRVPKYKHHAYEWLGVSKPEIAVMTELLLRGEQALGELRGRAGRMEPIADLAALQPIVAALLERGLMIELTPPGRGQIVSHGLYAASELAELRARFAGRTQPADSVHREADVPHHSPGAASMHASRQLTPPPNSPQAPIPAVPAEMFARQTTELAELRAELARLHDRVSELEARLEDAPG